MSHPKTADEVAEIIYEELATELAVIREDVLVVIAQRLCDKLMELECLEVI